MSTPRCAMCSTDLVHHPHVGDDAWACPTGHGVAVTPTEVHGAEEALEAVWARAAAAAAGIRHCPRCQVEMAVISLEGDPPVKADACPACQVLWFDSLEVAGLPTGQPDPAALVQRTIDHPTVSAVLRRTPSPV